MKRTIGVERLIAAARRLILVWEASPMRLPPAEREIKYALVLIDAEERAFSEAKREASSRFPPHDDDDDDADE